MKILKMKLLVFKKVEEQKRVAVFCQINVNSEQEKNVMIWEEILKVLN